MRAWDISDLDLIVARERVRARLPRQRGRALSAPLHFGPQPSAKVENGDLVLLRLRSNALAKASQRLQAQKPPPPRPYTPPKTKIAPAPPHAPPSPFLDTPDLQAQRVATYLVASTITVGHIVVPAISFAAYQIGLHDARVGFATFPPHDIVPAIVWVKDHLLAGHAVSANLFPGSWTLRSYAAINPATDFDRYRRRLTELGISLPKPP